MRLAVLESGADFYPDVMVSCDPRDAQAELALSHPCNGRGQVFNFNNPASDWNTWALLPWRWFTRCG